MNRGFWIVALAPGRSRNMSSGMFSISTSNTTQCHYSSAVLAFYFICVHPCQSVGQFSFQWEGVAQSFERKHATQTVDRFGRSVGFGGKQILEVLVLGRHKCLGPDDTGIHEIPGGDNGIVEGNAYFHVRPPKPSYLFFKRGVSI